MKNLTPQHYVLLLLSVVTLGCSILAYSLMYRATFASAVGAVVARDTAASASSQSLAAQKTQSSYAASAADRALLPTFFVSEEDAVPFIDRIESVASTTGASVSVSSLSAGPQGGTGPEAVSASVSIAGSWSAVMRSVELIENLPYALSVSDLRLAETGAVGSSAAVPHWSAQMSISALSVAGQTP